MVGLDAMRGPTSRAIEMGLFIMLKSETARRPRRAVLEFLCDQLLIVMPLLTDFTPRTSCASLVTRAFSAAELASPVMRIVPSRVTTLVLSALVDLWLSSAYFTWLVIEA